MAPRRRPPIVGCDAPDDATANHHLLTRLLRGLDLADDATDCKHLPGKAWQAYLRSRGVGNDCVPKPRREFE